MDLTCYEPSVAEMEQKEEKQEKENDMKHIKEVELYFTMKNENASLPQFKLKVIASGYQTMKENLIILFYVTNQRQDYFVDDMVKCIEEQWESNMSRRICCNYMFIEVVKDYLYCAKYYTESKHAIKGDLHIFYHNE